MLYKKIKSGLLIFDGRCQIINSTDATSATDVLVMEFANCEEYGLPTLLWLAREGEDLQSEQECFYKFAIEKYPAIKEVEKALVNPVYDPGKTKIVNFDLCQNSPQILYSMVMDYDWSIDAEPKNVILRKSA